MEIKFGHFACEIRTPQAGIYCRPYSKATWERYRLDDGLEVFTGYCTDRYCELLSSYEQRERDRIAAASKMTAEQERAWVARVVAQHG